MIPEDVLMPRPDCFITSHFPAVRAVEDEGPTHRASLALR